MQNLDLPAFASVAGCVINNDQKPFLFFWGGVPCYSYSITGPKTLLEPLRPLYHRTLFLIPYSNPYRPPLKGTLFELLRPLY